jgi:3-oxoacyl-[acyl-carrier-protein] synthase II
MGAFHARAAGIESLLQVLSAPEKKPVCNKIYLDAVDDKIQQYLSQDETRRIDKVSKLVLVSGLSCMQELAFENIDDVKNDLGVVANTCFGAMSSSKEFINTALRKGDKNASPILFPFSVPNAAAGILTIKLGIQGFNTTISGYNPIGYAFDLLTLNRAEGLFVVGFEEITEFIACIRMKENIFFEGNYSEGSVTLFMTNEEFAAEHNLPYLFEVCGFSSLYNSASIESFDNSKIIEEETIREAIKELLINSNLDINDLDVVVSAFVKGSCHAAIEERVLTDILGSTGYSIIYPRSMLGESFGANNTINVVAGYNYLKNNQSQKSALINNYDIGGNFSVVCIKI